MKVSYTQKIKYADVDTHLNQKLGSVFKLIQEAAVRHSEQVGFDTQTLLDRGEVWVLNAMAAEIYRYPELGEEVRVVTWHKKSKGFKAFRDFFIYAGSEKLAAATSLWLYFDINRKRLLRVPVETGRLYTTEAGDAIAGVVETWNPDEQFTPEFETGITIRDSDFDPLNHVNNAVYLDYLETLTARFFESKKTITGIKIQYKKEIGREVPLVHAGLAQTAAGCCFKLFDGEHLFAAGEIDFAAGK